MVVRRSWIAAIVLAASVFCTGVAFARTQENSYETISIQQIIEMWPNHKPLMNRLIREHGDDGVAELVNAFEDHGKSTELRANALSILNEIRAPQTNDLLVEALEEKNLQCMAISLSGWWHDARIVPLLAGFLSDQRVCGQEVETSTSSSEVQKTDSFASDAAVGALERITGLKFEAKSDLFEIGHRATKPWVDWWAANRVEFEADPKKFLTPEQPKKTDESDAHYLCTVDKVAISPDGTRMFSGSSSYDGRVRLWDLKTSEQIWVQRGHVSDITSAAFSPDGRLIASSSWDGSIMLWDAATGKRLRVLLVKDGVDSVAFSPNGSMMAAADDGGMIRFWSTQDWHVIRELNNGDMTEGIAFSPDGKLLAAAKFRGVQIWDVGTGEKIRALEVRPGTTPTEFPDEWAVEAQLWKMAWNVAFSRDGKYLATGSSAAVQIWNVADRKQVAWKPSHGQVVGLAYSPDGQWIVWGNLSDEIRTWNPTTHKTRRIKNFASMGDIGISPDGQRVFSPGAGQAIEIYELKTGKRVEEISCHK